jgi:hypothetical protein
LRTTVLISTVIATAIATLTASHTAHARLEWDAKYRARAAYHLLDPIDLAMHRHTVEGRAEYGLPQGWSIAAGARAYVDTAFESNGRYRTRPVNDLESQEFAVRDLYLQYKRRRFQLRFGNQQLVWGEAFGFFFADIINPKDTREFGLGGDLTAQRITVPMATAIFFLAKGTLQFVYIPKPVFNLTPALGSDFSSRLDELFPTVPTFIDAARSAPWSFSNGEFGLRASTVFGGWDLALFFLTYFDRAPVYTLDLTPTRATFVQTHPKLTTVGVTGTKDFDSVLLRFETLYTRNRPINTFNLTPLNLEQSLRTERTDEWVGVLGLDYTRWKSWRAGVQVSHHLLTETFSGAFLPANRTQISFSLFGPLYKEQSIDVIWSYFFGDASQLLQLSYHVPVTDSMDMSVGTYVFAGGDNSQFGRFKNASRIFAQFTAHFGG